MGTGIASKRQIDPLLRALDDLGYRPGERPRLEKHPDGVLLRRKRKSGAGARPSSDGPRPNGAKRAEDDLESICGGDPARVEGLRRVVKELERFYHGDRDRMAAFLARPHLLLEERTPFDVARSGPEGADKVLEIIGRAAAGVAV